MFAIEITQENIPSIMNTLGSPTLSIALSLDKYAALKAKYYYINGYTTPRGGEPRRTVLPEYIIKENFEYDAEKIAHSWDQIVRIQN